VVWWDQDKLIWFRWCQACVAVTRWGVQRQVCLVYSQAWCGNVMVWDCMSAAGTGELQLIEGTMNANMSEAVHDPLPSETGPQDSVTSQDLYKWECPFLCVCSVCFALSLSLSLPLSLRLIKVNRWSSISRWLCWWLHSPDWSIRGNVWELKGRAEMFGVWWLGARIPTADFFFCVYG